MSILSLLSSDRVFNNLEGGSKKRALEIISEHLAQSHSDLAEEAVFSGLINRERLGSTGIGDGVAIPHCRLPGLQEAVGVFVRLATPVDFDAIDNRPVDLMFFLLVPEDACDQHLATLGALAEAFSKEENRNKMRSAASDSELMQILESTFN